MTISGHMLLGAEEVMGTSKQIYAINPATGEKIEPAFGGGTQSDVDLACEKAVRAFSGFRNLTNEARAAFIDSCADNIMALGDELVERVMAESGLPQARVVGERGRTVGQLKLFAELIRKGDYQGARIDTAMPDREPMPRQDHRMRYVPLGPVAVFGASNFPLAFSVAGGDTAAAFAAGCPVIVKAHSSHPGTSELVGRALQKAVADHGLDEGVFSLVFGSGREVGAALVSHPVIKAVGFTGSEGGGTALMKLAAARPEPIPVYAEMSSINPVFLLPDALATRGAEIGSSLVASMMMGAGQFCTSPGLIISMSGDGYDDFVASARKAISEAAPQTMLSPTIHEAYKKGVEHLSSMSELSELAQGQEAPGCQCRAALFEVSAKDFIANEDLREEVFGSCSLVVRCETGEQLINVLNSLRGQLTGAIHATDAEDPELVQGLIEALELKVGRIIWNGFGTGVEVCHAMVHGGPYPATADGRSTSVGTAAIDRFMRPVCYQNMPNKYLPASVDEDNSLGICRLVNGEVVVS